MATLITTTNQMNHIDPQAWLADVLAASPSTQLTGSTISCPGIGVLAKQHMSRLPDLGRSLPCLHHHLVAELLGEDENRLLSIDMFPQPRAWPRPFNGASRGAHGKLTSK
jgi:hypothetical protein